MSVVDMERRGWINTFVVKVESIEWLDAVDYGKGRNQGDSSVLAWVFEKVEEDRGIGFENKIGSKPRIVLDKDQEWESAPEMIQGSDV